MIPTIYLNQKEAIARMETFAKNKTPFVFVISYDKSISVVEALDAVDPQELLFDFSGVSNVPSDLSVIPSNVKWQFTKPSRTDYHRSFRMVQDAEREQGIVILST